MPGGQAKCLVPPILEVRQTATDRQSVRCRKHHTLTHEALLAVPTSTALTIPGGGTLLELARLGRGASRGWRLLLLMMMMITMMVTMMVMMMMMMMM